MTHVRLLAIEGIILLYPNFTHLPLLSRPDVLIGHGYKQFRMQRLFKKHPLHVVHDIHFLFCFGPSIGFKANIFRYWLLDSYRRTKLLVILDSQQLEGF